MQQAAETGQLEEAQPARALTLNDLNLLREAGYPDDTISSMSAEEGVQIADSLIAARTAQQTLEGLQRQAESTGWTPELTAARTEAEQALNRAQNQRPATPVEQAGSAWDQMSTANRLMAAQEAGEQGVIAQHLATRDWSSLSDAQREKLVEAVNQQQGNRWTDPNRRASDQESPVLQPRDRQSEASINQMRDMAKAPDYARASYSRTFMDGAPVTIDEVPDIPEAQLGRQERVTTDGSRTIPIQYAALEADQLAGSHAVDGTAIPEWSNGTPGISRAVAGNGRVEGFKEAWRQGNAEQYKADMMADDLHGISPKVIQGMKQPILVRLMPASEVTQDIGDLSNRDSKLDSDPVETAKADGRAVTLSELKYSDSGAVGGDTIMDFISKLPGATNLVQDGKPTQEAIDRLNAAIFQKAYSNDALTRLMTERGEGARSVINALAQAAPHMTKLEGMDVFDMRGLVAQAAEFAINASNKEGGLSAHVRQTDMGADPHIYPILEMMVNEQGNVRSAKYIAEQLTNLADLAHYEYTKDSADMLGENPRRTRQQIIDDAFEGVTGNVRPAEQTAETDSEQSGSQEDLGQPGRPEPDGQVAEGPESGRERPADSGQAAQPEQQAGVERPDNWRSFYPSAAKIARELGIDPRQHRRLPDLVAAIDAHDKAQQPTESAAQTQEGRAPEVQLTEDGRSVRVYGDRAEVRAKLREAGITLPGAEIEGGLSFAARLETQIRDALGVQEQVEEATTEVTDEVPQDMADDFDLETQTEEELAQQEAEQKAQQEAEAKQKAAEKAEAKRRKDEQNTKARADEVVENFELGQDASEAMDGMGDMFSQQVATRAPQPAKSPITLTSEAEITAAAAEIARHTNIETKKDGSVLLKGKQIAKFDKPPTSIEQVIRPMLEAMRDSLKQAGKTWPRNPEQMTRDQFVISYEFADLVPEFEILGMDIGTVVVPDARGAFTVDADALYDKIQQQAQQTHSQQTQETGAFGPIFKQFKHDAQGAIEHLRKQQTGEAVAALHHPEVGDIDLVWGKEGTKTKEYEDGMGLAKIIKKHSEVLDDLQGFVSDLSVQKRSKNRVVLSDGSGKALVRLDWDGESKHWLLTAYDDSKKTSVANEGRTGVFTGAESAPPADQRTEAEPSIPQAEKPAQPKQGKGALPAILKQSREKYLKRQIKGIKLKEGTPAHDAEVEALEARYDSDLEAAYAQLDFETYNKLNSDTPEGINRSAWESMRQEAGLKFSRTADSDAAEGQRQFKETERAYGGRDAYSRAKEAGKTKLNYQQWVQVRTPAFKEWFGDWEVAAAQLEREASNFTEARQAAKAFQGKPLTNSSTGIVATVSRNNLDKMLNRKAVGKSASPALHSAAVANLDSMFERAVLGWSKPDNEGDPNIKAIHRFFTPVMVDGKAMMAKMTVKETEQDARPNPLYTVEAVSFEELKHPAAQWVGEIAEADGIDPRTTRSAGLIQSMAQSVQQFNPANVSKVTDPETGEPMVMYHGTPGDFNSFDNKKTGTNDRGLWGKGHYFASSPETASSYALRQGDGANVVPTFVLIRNPLTLTTDADRVTRLPDGTNYRDLLGQNLDGSKIKDIAKSGRHDGIIQIKPDGLIGDLVAYDSGQIKSASGNAGTFRKDTDNITRSQRQQPEPTGSTAQSIRQSLQKAYGKLIDRLETKGMVKLVQTADEAMEAVAVARKEAGKEVDPKTLESIRSDQGVTEGFYDPKPGKSFLIADALTSETAPGTLLHEVGIHMAADGANMTGLFEQAKKLLENNSNNPFIQRVRERMEDAGETSAEEAAAYIVTEYENNRLLAPRGISQLAKDMVAAIRGWLFKKGIVLKTEDLKPADIAAIARANVRAIAGKGPGARHGASSISEGSDPANAAQVEAAIEGKDIHQIAEHLARTMDPSRATIAEAVGKKLRALAKQGVKLDFKKTAIGTYAPSALNHSRGYTEFGFDENEALSVTVWIHGAEMTGRVGMDNEYILHELVHAATGAATQLGRMHPSGKYGALNKALLDLQDAVVERIIERRKELGESGLTDFERDILTSSNNAVHSEDEILAWGLTNPGMQALMEDTKYKKGGAWGEFVSIIRQLLGLNPAADTALSELLRIADKLLDAEGHETAQLRNIAKFGHPMYSTQGTRNKWGMANPAGSVSAGDIRFSRKKAQTAVDNIMGWAHKIDARTNRKRAMPEGMSPEQ